MVYKQYIDGLKHGCSIFSALAIEILQSCIKPSICSNCKFGLLEAVLKPLPLSHNVLKRLLALDNLIATNSHRSDFRWRLNCLPNPLFRHRSRKPPKLRITGFCEGNPSVTGRFLSERASNAESISIWCSHHDIVPLAPWLKFVPVVTLLTDCHSWYVNDSLKPGEACVLRRSALAQLVAYCMSVAE